MNSLSGQVYDGRISLSALGAFSVHLMEYCPPWYGRDPENPILPCVEDNLMGRFAFWFNDSHIYGIHGRSVGLYQERFDDSDRKQTRGCIALHDDSLKNLMFMIRFLTLLLFKIILELIRSGSITKHKNAPM